MIPTAPKIAKNHFKCFHCRRVVAQRDGDWFNWDSMQVHLCRPCEKVTKGKTERSHAS